MGSSTESVEETPPGVPSAPIKGVEKQGCVGLRQRRSHHVTSGTLGITPPVVPDSRRETRCVAINRCRVNIPLVR